MEQFITYLKESGFVFQGSRIYGGMANSWDFGPLGIELKNNIKSLWWKRFVQQDKNIEGLDSSIILAPKVWEASGHLSNFSDLLIDCKECKSRYRADMLVESKTNENVERWDFGKLEKFIKEKEINCLNCKKLNYTQIRNFNLMFETDMSIIGEDQKAYLRPETAQGIFINFAAVAKSANKKLPFGIGQIGKAFRNEITPGNFIFRTKEFEQMELEFFFNNEIDKNDWFDFYVNKVEEFLLEVGVDKNLITKREHDTNELSHYSKATTDFEFKFPFGQKELCGIAHRNQFDINSHNQFAQEKQMIRDGEENIEVIPSVIEPSFGVERLMLAILLSSFQKIDDRDVLKIEPKLAPIKVAILPLIKKVHSQKANEVYEVFAQKFNTKLSENGSIGKRYKKQDKIGTPFCITIDDQSLESNIVTIRNRDDSSQETLSIKDAIDKIQKVVLI